jgi:hypothetical protein
MVNWVLILIGVFIVAILYIKFEHTGKRIKLVLIVLFIAFLYISGSVVLSKAGVKLNSVDGFGKAVTLYFSWLASASSNLWNSGGDIAKTVGNAIGTNSTNVR